MPSDFQFKEPPLALGIPKGRPWYGMDIFLNRPMNVGVSAVALGSSFVQSVPAKACFLV